LPAESGLPAGKERVRLLFPGAEPLCAGGNTGPSGPPGKRKTSRAGGRGTHKTPPVHGEAESESALPVPAECGQPQGGITVTDSQGVSPYSVCRTGGAGWHLLTSVLY